MPQNTNAEVRNKQVYLEARVMSYVCDMCEKEGLRPVDAIAILMAGSIRLATLYDFDLDTKALLEGIKRTMSSDIDMMIKKVAEYGQHEARVQAATYFLKDPEKVDEVMMKLRVREEEEDGANTTKH